MAAHATDDQGLLFDYVAIVVLSDEGACTGARGFFVAALFCVLAVRRLVHGSRPVLDTGNPVLESVFPEEKRDETRGILHFCWPEGKAARANPLSTRSENFSFVLTEGDGSKRFGCGGRACVESVFHNFPQVLPTLLAHLAARMLLRSHQVAICGAVSGAAQYC